MIAGEHRTLLRGVSWSTYEALLADLGPHRGRIAYDEGMLEILSPSGTHEGIKRLVGRFIEVITEELRIKIRSTSSITLMRMELKKGVEADESYYIQNEARVRHKEIDVAVDPPPDLAIEVEISRSTLDHLAIHAALGVPEVWRYDGMRLRFFRLNERGQYVESEKSSALPMLPLADLRRFLELRTTLDETELVVAFRKWVPRAIREGMRNVPLCPLPEISLPGNDLRIGINELRRRCLRPAFAGQVRRYPYARRIRLFPFPVPARGHLDLHPGHRDRRFLLVQNRRSALPQFPQTEHGGARHVRPGNRSGAEGLTPGSPFPYP
jgi:Uma2 family endonuclease